MMEKRERRRRSARHVMFPVENEGIAIWLSLITIKQTVNASGLFILKFDELYAASLRPSQTTYIYIYAFLISLFVNWALCIFNFLASS
jgi:hypothetical protein